MIASAFGTMLLVIAGQPAPRASPGDGRETIEYAQVTIQQRVIVRVPMQAVRPPKPVKWKEKRGPKCAPMDGVAGAAVVKPDSVDILYRGGLRLRAELEDECPALDYYNGFYIAPTKDRQICAGRDSLHSRSGGECGIERFRRLEPDK